MYMLQHNLCLAEMPFKAILSGHKTIESRLFDAKRKQIQLGDTLQFQHKSNASQIINAKVIGLLRYQSFEELFSHNDPTKFGGPNTIWLLTQIRQFYSAEDEQKYGVIGIEFELL